MKQNLGKSSAVHFPATLTSRKAIVIAAAGLFTLHGVPSLAATINVGVGACTRLADAITAANTNATVSGCVGDAAGADSIVLLANSTHTLTTLNNGDDLNPNGLPVVTSTITIQGNNSTVRRDPNALARFRIFAVGVGGDLTLRRTTVSGGSLLQAGGAGIANLAGSLSVVDSTISGNVAGDIGGGIFAAYANPNTTTSLTNSTVSGNTASEGGGLALRGGLLSLGNSTVSGNAANGGGNGGGVYHGLGTLSLANSTVSGNSATSLGGGVFSGVGALSLSISNSTVSGNTGGRAGGISSRTTSSILSSTISGNRATYFRAGLGVGGVLNNYGNMVIRNSTITNNTAPEGGTGGISSVGEEYSLRMAASIVSGNLGADFDFSYDSQVSSDGGNLIGDGNAVSVFTANGDVTGNANPRLGVLRNNGGRTQTHALCGSAAIDAVRGTSCAGLSTDQRGSGFARVVEGDGKSPARCDIGAFEFKFPALRFARASESVAESAGEISVSLRLSAPTSCPITAKLKYRGSAVLGRDFTAPTQVNIAVGQSHATFKLRVTNDKLDEANETIQLELGALSAAVKTSPSTRTLTITDNDPTPSVAFIRPSVDAQENRGVESVVLRLSAVSGRSVTVPLRYSGGATRNTDYRGPDTVSIPAGRREASIPITILDETAKEPQESIVIDLGTPTDATAGGSKRHTIRIAASD